MANARTKILHFSIITRLAIILLQVISNAIIPDHSADAFRGPTDPHEHISPFDKLISVLFGGLIRWDSEYYLHIARYGYTYENTLAFLPLYPMTIRTLSIVLRKIIFFANYQSILTISAIFINFLCFVKSTLVLFDLSCLILPKKIAYRSAILYCISPAAIFFTAAYTESMFAYLTFYSMLSSVKRNPFASLPIGLSSLVRSNGLVNLGFPLYIWWQNGILDFSILLRQRRTKFSVLAGLAIILTSFSQLFKIVLLSIAPFLLLQTYNYVSFCTESANVTSLAPHVRVYGDTHELVMPGRGIPPWCHYKIPSAYSYIQQRYWNVGFFNYYEVKQIPNFILAFPVLFIMSKCIFSYFKDNWRDVLRLKVLNFEFGGGIGKGKKYPNMFLFIVHGLFLTIFCIFFVHIQVSTRLLGSASPLLYWYSAMLISGSDYDDWEDKNCVNSWWQVWFMVKTKWTREEKLILGYFMGYTIVGTCMYSNFLPWT